MVWRDRGSAALAPAISVSGEAQMVYNVTINWWVVAYIATVIVCWCTIYRCIQAIIGLRASLEQMREANRRQAEVGGTLAAQVDSLTGTTLDLRRNNDELREALNVAHRQNNNGFELVYSLGIVGPARPVPEKELLIVADVYDREQMFAAHGGDSIVVLVCSELFGDYTYMQWDVPLYATGHDTPLWTLVWLALSNGREISPDAWHREQRGEPYAYTRHRRPTQYNYIVTHEGRRVPEREMQALANPPDPARPAGYRRLTVRRK